MAKLVRSNRLTAAHGAIAVVLLILSIIPMHEAWADMAGIAWEDEESSHVLLVAPIAAWLAWIRRGRIRQCRPRGMWIGPAIILLGWAVSTWGYVAGFQSLWHGGAVLVAVGAILSALGRDILVRLFPAFLVLVFLVPVPRIVRQQVAVPLQTATAHVTQSLLEHTGMPVRRSGNLLEANGGAVAVAEACNGMRMVFALVLVSYAFAFSEPLRNWVRLLIVLASPLSALLCNVLRMLPTVWLYTYASQRTADLFHDASGWLMLGLGCLLLMGILRMLRWSFVPVARYMLAG